MMRPTIYLIIYIKKLYNNFVRRLRRSHETKEKINMEVPTMCKNRKDKDFIICSTIDFLEQNIKIKNYE